jgi:hypothetical protein
MGYITPYIRGQYPLIEGNDRVYFDTEFRKIQECFRSILTALSGSLETATIASGALALMNSSSPIRILEVDTESAAASDDLDTITGGKEGQVIIVKAAADARTVVVKDSTGNLELSADMTLDHTEDTLTLYNKSGTSWRELARSDNTA